MAKGKSAAAANEAKLTTEDWETAALDAIAERGVAGVAVEPLARKLGVTKGSFYWHFAHRESLLEAALSHWEDIHTEKVIAGLAQVGDPRERLVQLIGRALGGGRSDRIHIAISTSTHPLARRALARVTHRRLNYLAHCYVELGQLPSEAQRSALLAYAVYIGLVHLRLEAPRELPAREDYAGYVEDLVRKLVP